MHRYLTICALLLSACGREIIVEVNVPPSLLAGCPGYTGSTPSEEGQFVDAAIAERRGRICANRKIEAISKIVGPQ